MNNLNFIILIIVLIGFSYRLYLYLKFRFKWENNVRKKIGINEDNWNKLSLNEKILIKTEYFKANGAGVKFKAVNESKIQYPNWDNVFVSGYFSDSEGTELGIALGGEIKDWFPVFVHESCHMDQWIENTEVWKRGFFGTTDCYDLLEQWIQGKEFPDWEIKKIIRACIEIELDCEKRSVIKLTENDLGYSIEEYIRKSNSYIFFYGAILKTRKWYKNPPYRITDVYNIFPDSFKEIDEYLDCSDEIVELYKKHCF